MVWSLWLPKKYSHLFFGAPLPVLLLSMALHCFVVLAHLLRSRAAKFSLWHTTSRAPKIKQLTASQRNKIKTHTHTQLQYYAWHTCSSTRPPFWCLKIFALQVVWGSIGGKDMHAATPMFGCVFPLPWWQWKRKQSAIDIHRQGMMCRSMYVMVLCICKFAHSCKFP